MKRKLLVVDAAECHYFDIAADGPAGERDAAVTYGSGLLKARSRLSGIDVWD